MMVLTLLAMIFLGVACILHVCSHHENVKAARRTGPTLFYMLIFIIVAGLLCAFIKVFEQQIVQVVDFIYSNIMGL